MSKPEGETYPDKVSTLRFPWNEIRGALDASAPGPDGAQSVNYANPIDGSAILPTLDSRAFSLADGKPTQPRRSTASELFVVLEGKGESRIGDVTHGWAEKDVFTVPHWSWARHEARGGTAHIIVISDREMMKRLDLYREETERA